MKTRTVTLPQLALIGGTRVALGAGLGLLLGDRLAPSQRRAVGLTLLAVGVITTIPLFADVVLRNRRSEATAGMGSPPTERADAGVAAQVP